MTRGVPGTLVIPPMTPASRPATGDSHGSQRLDTCSVRPVAFSATNPTMKRPRIKVAVRDERATRRRVPKTVPTAPKSSSTPNRLTVAMGAPRRTNWMLSITMLGRMRTTTAAFTSMTRLSSGVPSVGKPKPMAPLRRAESRTMPPARIALRTGSVSERSAGRAATSRGWRPRGRYRDRAWRPSLARGARPGRRSERAVSDGALHPDVGAAVVVVARDLAEAVGAIETHGGGQLGLAVETKGVAAQAARLVEARVEQAAAEPLALTDGAEPHALE